MSRYLSIKARNEPYPLGQLDGNKNLIFSLNFDIQIDGPISSPVEKEIIARLVETNIGTQFSVNNLAGTIYVGPKAVIPATNSTAPVGGPFINILSTGGVRPIEFHDHYKVRRPSIQILTFCADYWIGNAKAYDIFNALNGFERQVINAL